MCHSSTIKNIFLKKTPANPNTTTSKFQVDFFGSDPLDYQENQEKLVSKAINTERSWMNLVYIQPVPAFWAIPLLVFGLGLTGSHLTVLTFCYLVGYHLKIGGWMLKMKL